MKKILYVFFVLLFCIWAGVRIVASIQFDRGCEGYLTKGLLMLTQLNWQSSNSKSLLIIWSAKG